MGLNAKLRKLALQMPPFPDPAHKGQSCRRVLNGEQMRAIGQTHVKGKEGMIEPVQADKYYTVELQYVPIDHFKQMKALHTAGGPPAVAEYLEKVKQYHQLNKK